MRKNSEKKTKVTSIRLTEEQHTKVQQKADENNMSMSNYMITIATSNEPALNPKVMVQIQNIVNDAIETINEYAPEKKENMEKEVNKLWSLLK